jgi:hypothetical protein
VRWEGIHKGIEMPHKPKGLEIEHDVLLEHQGRISPLGQCSACSEKVAHRAPEGGEKLGLSGLLAKKGVRSLGRHARSAQGLGGWHASHNGLAGGGNAVAQELRELGLGHRPRLEADVVDL